MKRKRQVLLISTYFPVIGFLLNDMFQNLKKIDSDLTTENFKKNIKTVLVSIYLKTILQIIEKAIANFLLK